jgi:large subunit ribosomal protein L9e
MRLVYAHFPINANAEKGGKELSIRNFLGEKIVRQIPMCEGVNVIKDVDVKDQLLFEGNNIEAVSRCALCCGTQ